ncbi:hypothetical protein CSAL01_00618 [Colletotrichum salicis]|uniref:Uncharacterized protein n=1 Tax=Colletotrichum salicis TaxID=1209931 RepID=A0A135U2A1_9PEZI|nr:hypothetical protein CSAL01_00618 [Colletotrichum salicis]
MAMPQRQRLPDCPPTLLADAIVARGFSIVIHAGRSPFDEVAHYHSIQARFFKKQPIAAVPALAGAWSFLPVSQLSVVPDPNSDVPEQKRKAGC